MPIVPSRRAEIDALIAQLGNRLDTTRDTAVARLTLLGERAVPSLTRYLPSATPRGAEAALTVLEHIDAPQALPRILELCFSPHDAVARRAIEVRARRADQSAVEAFSRVLAARSAPPVRAAAVAGLAQAYQRGVLEALGPLTDVVLDERAEEKLRLLAFDVLAELPLDEIRPAIDRLRTTKNRALRARLEALATGAEDPRMLARRLPSQNAQAARDTFDRLVLRGLDGAAALIEEIKSDRLPARLAPAATEALRRMASEAVPLLNKAMEDAESPRPARVLCDALAYFHSPSSIPALHAALKNLSRKDAGAGSEERAEAKAHVHLTLALFESRIALYDLQEMLAARPVRALASLARAAERIGDASLIPSLAAIATDDPGAFEYCASAFSAIVLRGKLRRGGKADARARPEHRATLENLWRFARSHRRGRT